MASGDGCCCALTGWEKNSRPRKVPRKRSAMAVLAKPFIRHAPGWCRSRKAVVFYSKSLIAPKTGMQLENASDQIPTNPPSARPSPFTQIPPTQLVDLSYSAYKREATFGPVIPPTQLVDTSYFAYNSRNPMLSVAFQAKYEK